MGSFLFLGPTGVGKTETAKSLARVMFRGEDNMVRFDMSEYTDGEALQKLIGSFQTEKVGRLPSILRENKYGVLYASKTRSISSLSL
jgi:ATP-dependent Clp protease ATP-binding subunit ClpA